MHRISIHPASALIGLAFGVVVLLSMSQVMPPTSNVLVGYGPNPRDMVQIRGGTPFTVPAGRIFVLTGLGNTDGDAGAPQKVGLLVNGQRELATDTNFAYDTPSMKVAPTGFTASAGSVVEVVEITGSQEPLKTRAWGYLAPQ